MKPKSFAATSPEGGFNLEKMMARKDKVVAGPPRGTIYSEKRRDPLLRTWPILTRSQLSLKVVAAGP